MSEKTQAVEWVCKNPQGREVGKTSPTFRRHLNVGRSVEIILNGTTERGWFMIQRISESETENVLFGVLD